ncbi:MAG: type II toxin-antitoxin system VapC family toxin [Gammaproteobacteria bacterium]|nr:type II toxin-antitoxin system VapC family toxin [Gammaproteobacteria bacterium]
MVCMLDTVHCVHLLMRSPQVIPQAPIRDCRVSTVVVGELETGVLQSSGTARQRNHEALLDFLSAVQVYSLDEYVAQAYAGLRAGTGHPAPAVQGNELWVIAHALALELPLVTHRAHQLADVPGLVADSWLGAGG